MQSHYNKQAKTKSTPVYSLDGPLSNVWIKDESSNITGTHKDRSFRHWIPLLVKRGVKEAVISSSGSAARSAKYFCGQAGIRLVIFTPAISKTPKKDAIAYAREHRVPYLRSSTDDDAIEGYKTIAEELREQVPDAEEIFVPVSSGAALIGIARGYGSAAPRIYIVQTTKVHPMAEMFDDTFTPEDTHISRAIVDRVAHRKRAVIDAIETSGGGGYVISNAELKSAKNMYGTTKAGNESFLTVAALIKHRTKHPEYKDAKTVCLFTN